MYRDRSLIPAEAIRLAALGVLAGGPRPYRDVANEVRGFATRVAGPSLDVLGSNLELLRHEGLVGAVSGEGEAALLEITVAGRAALDELLRANVRLPLDGVSRLVLALKLRFLSLLPADEARDQVDRLIAASESEAARLGELARDYAADGALASWLGTEEAQASARVAWLEDLLARL